MQVNLLEKPSPMNPGNRIRMWERRPASIVIAASCRSHRKIMIAPE
jgi:hypothetical protein